MLLANIKDIWTTPTEIVPLPLSLTCECFCQLTRKLKEVRGLEKTLGFQQKFCKIISTFFPDSSHLWILQKQWLNSKIFSKTIFGKKMRTTQEWSRFIFRGLSSIYNKVFKWKLVHDQGSLINFYSSWNRQKSYGFMFRGNRV